MTPPRKGRRPRKPRGGVSRSGCRKVDRILVLSPIQRERACRWEAGEE
jgi:hypothetical protein